MLSSSMGWRAACDYDDDGRRKMHQSSQHGTAEVVPLVVAEKLD
jgi:hypothetical protein